MFSITTQDFLQSQDKLKGIMADIARRVELEEHEESQTSASYIEPTSLHEVIYLAS